MSEGAGELRDSMLKSGAYRATTWRRCLLLALPLLLFPVGDALAHIKWFADFDMTTPPRPVGEVLNGPFIAFFFASIVFVYLFFIVDRYVLRWGIMQEALGRYTVSEPTAFAVMRVAVLTFFAALSVYGFTGNGFFLTPELKTDARWVPFAQVAISLCALNRRTAPLVGVGIAILYAVAVRVYGFFHLLDYLILAGVAFFFLASAMARAGWVTARYIVLFATTGLTLLWAAIEKWAYPSWTYPLLARDPSLLMGLSPESYMLLAGWVEFNVTFILLSAASLFSRAIAFAFGSLFALAIYKFGMVDAVGHLLIIAILFVLVVRGPTKGREILVLDGKSLGTEAYFMVGNYTFWFVIAFTSYYGLHWLAYGN
jgi:hypothetical protein